MTTKKATAAASAPSNPLKVPYKSQLDNANNPTGSCNVTSMAMVLEFMGIKGTGDGQLEDQLYRLMEEKELSRHSPEDLAYMVNEIVGKRISPNIVDTFRAGATIEQIKASIDAGFPVVIHGYFTHFGHIIAVIGYDEEGFIVHDPYGEYHIDGYDCGVSGESLHYSYGLITRTCDHDGIWTHFFSYAK